MPVGASMLRGLGGGSLGTLFITLTANPAALINGINQAVKSVEGGSAKILDKLTRMSVSFAAVLGGAAVKAAADFEESFAGVRKTIDATENEFKRLEGAFRDMSKQIPVSVNEINRVAEAAGQLGIKNENIVGFTKTMVAMGVATRMSSEEAATSLARLANITQMPQENFDRLGATIVDLDNKLATTASEITEMALRIAGAGKVVGMTEAEIVSFAAAVSSVGIQAEAGGTAISQAMINMSEAVKTGNEHLGTFALVAGKSVDEFSRLFQTDATQAIVAFINGLNTMKDSGEDVFGVLDQLGLDGARMTRVMLGLSGAGDLVNRSLAIGNEAWRSNRALVEESEKRYKTFWNQLKLTWNIINDVLITVGQELLPVLKLLNGSLQGWLKSQEDLNKTGSDWVNNVAPAFLTIIGMIGDAFRGWQIIIKTLQLGFSQLALNQGKMWDFVLDKIIKVTTAVAKIILKLQEAVASIPGAAELMGAGGLNVAPILNTLREVQIAHESAVQDVTDTVKQNQKELNDLVNKGSFSENLRKQFEGLSRDGVKPMMSTLEDYKNALAAAAQETKKLEVATGSLTPKLSSTTATKSIDDQFSQMFGDKAKVGEAHFVKRAGEDPTAHIREMQVDQKNAQERLAFLETVGAQEVRITDETNQKKLELMKAYNEQLRALQLAQAAIVFQASQQIFGDLATITKEFAGEQAGVYKAMFAASKAFAIAEATVKIAQGIAQAAATGTTWVEKLVAIASVTAATASIVSNIRSVQLEFGGERALGGPVGAGKAFLVGERGQEMFVPNSAGNIIPNDDLRGMGSNVRVEINNFTDGTASVTERDDNGERVIEVTIQRTKREIASEIRDGRGEVSRAMESSFGLRRGK